MFSYILVALVASAPALASFAQLAAFDSSLTSRDDPCAQWCDPWFAITDAEVACQFLSTNASTFETCGGCSIAHGGSVDDWAADYYNGDYAFYTDCPACYEINVAGIDFSTVSSMYNAIVSPSASAAASTLAISSSSINGTASPITSGKGNGSVKVSSASNSASTKPKSAAAAATQEFDNSGIKAHSGAFKTGSKALTTLLLSTVLACFLI